MDRILYHLTKIQQPFKDDTISRDFIIHVNWPAPRLSTVAFLFFQGVVVNNIIDNKNDDSDDADNGGDCVCCLHSCWERRRKCLTRRRVSARFLCAPQFSPPIIPIIVYEKLFISLYCSNYFRKLSTILFKSLFLILLFYLPLFVKQIEIIRVYYRVLSVKIREIDFLNNFK